MTSFTLKLITPAGIKFEGEISEASLPTPDGQVSVLANHMPLITQISPGEIKIQSGGRDQYLATEGGVAYVSQNFLKILADTAESADSLDNAKIEEAKGKARQLKANATDETEFAFAEALLEKQLAKIRFIKRHKH